MRPTGPGRARLVGLATLALLLAGSVAWGQPEADVAAASQVVMQQLEAFRQGDFDRAYTFASSMIQGMFDRGAFERMVRGGYPEIARAAEAALSRSTLAPNGNVYLYLKIRGANGQRIEAVYEMVWEDGSWKVNGVVTRSDPSDHASIGLTRPTRPTTLAR